MKRKLMLLTSLWLVLGVVLTACGGGQAEADVTPTAVGEGPRVDGEGEAVPDDLPIIPGAYNLDVFSSGTQVNFRVDGSIENVMSFYVTALEENGWMPTRAPDNAIGVTGTMSRQNGAGDNISLNMSYNGDGDFVNVLIAISRK